MNIIVGNLNVWRLDIRILKFDNLVKIWNNIIIKVYIGVIKE